MTTYKDLLAQAQLDQVIARGALVVAERTAEETHARANAARIELYQAQAVYGRYSDLVGALEKAVDA